MCIRDRFIDELPPDNVEPVSEPGLYGAMPAAGAGGLRDSAAWPEGETWRPRRFRAQPLIDAVAFDVGARDAPDRPFETGQRVFHQKFGYGRVIAVDGEKLEVAFEKAGTKKVIDSFVEAA